MKKPNPFLHAREDYRRDLDYLGHYISQSAQYLARMRDISYDEAKAFITEQLKPGGAHAFTDIRVTHTQRDGVGKDRYERENTLHNYIREALEAGDIIAPTLTRYVSPYKYQSPSSTFMVDNTTARDVSKQLMFEARVRGDNEARVYYNNKQISEKTSNNSDSGAQMIPSTALYNASGHPSLTSNCRITAAYGSTNNERMVSGMRHYYTPDLARANILTIVDNFNHAQAQAMMDEWRLHYPSAEEVFTMVERSSRHYWSSATEAQSLLALLERLTPLERAMVLYTGDMYHVRQYNPIFIREFIDAIMDIDHPPHPDPDAAMKACDGDFINHAWGLQGQVTVELANQSKGLWDMKGTELFARTAATAENIYRVLDRYQSFVKTLLISYAVPASVVRFPVAIRESVLTGDTDSTIYTVQEWVKWYKGDYVLDELGLKVFTTMVFISSQTIAHVLACMSANMGVHKDRLHDNTMKNEYRFDLFNPTQVSKHYISATGAQEGRIFKELEFDRKGVNLVSSAVPLKVMQKLEKRVKEMGETVLRGGKISMIREICQTATLELEILNSIKAGEHTFFRFNQIRGADTYKSPPDRSPYSHYTMWEAVFAPKYGHTVEPPYSALKVNTTINSANSFKLWLDSLEDQALAFRFREWCLQNNKTHVATFYLPEQVIQSTGIPDEIFQAMDKRRIILDNMGSFYLYLTTLGLHVLEGKMDRLLIDYPFIPIQDSDPA